MAHRVTALVACRWATRGYSWTARWRRGRWRLERRIVLNLPQAIGMDARCSGRHVGAAAEASHLALVHLWLHMRRGATM